ncbi:Anti-sigma factor [Tenacibaculum soleae]|uniref:FecR family protein n=1 Tax=Tenacibaculum soleae TaxID=447689 RepID=UPI003AB4972A
MEKDQLLKKWLGNKLSPKEQKTFDSMEDSAFFKEIVEEAKRFKETVNYKKVISFNVIEKHIDQKKTSNIKKIDWFKLTSSIAAILVIGFSFLYFLNNSQLKTFNTQISQKEKIILPDNSIVTLNETSKLKYNTKQWENKKSLTLKGEAFFDVTKGKRFDVKTSYGIISVLGTEFNVEARDNVFNVICYEGSVQVSYNGQLIRLSAGNAFKVTKGNNLKYNIATSKPQWLNNMSVFNQKKVSEVLNTLSKQFNIKVIYNTIDTSILFTGAFEHNNLENALISITKTLNLTYEINNNTVIVKNAKK